MRTKVEGILIHRVPFKERDIIGKLLLRSGKRISVIFHGAQGGGPKRRSSVVELGHLLSLELHQKKKNTQEDLYVAKEWTLSWAPHKIRLHHQAFFLMNFYFEVMLKISIAAALQEPDNEGDDQEGLFRVLSNALFYLEKELNLESPPESTVKPGPMTQQMLLFLGKLLFETGVAPLLQGCIFCEKDLEFSERVQLVPQEGGFSCLECAQNKDSPSAKLSGNSGELRRKLLKIHQMKYADYRNLPPPPAGVLGQIFHYFCFHFHLDESHFRSYKMLI